MSDTKKSSTNAAIVTQPEETQVSVPIKPVKNENKDLTLEDVEIELAPKEEPGEDSEVGSQVETMSRQTSIKRKASVALVSLQQKLKSAMNRLDDLKSGSSKLGRRLSRSVSQMSFKSGTTRPRLRSRKDENGNSAEFSGSKKGKGGVAKKTSDHPVRSFRTREKEKEALLAFWKAKAEAHDRISLELKKQRRRQLGLPAEAMALADFQGFDSPYDDDELRDMTNTKLKRAIKKTFGSSNKKVGKSEKKKQVNDSVYSDYEFSYGEDEEIEGMRTSMDSDASLNAWMDNQPLL